MLRAPRRPAARGTACGEEDAAMRQLRIAAALAALAAAIAVALAVAVRRSDAVQDRLVARMAAATLDGGAGARLAEGDALRVLVCGSSSPLPSPDRAQPCTAVFAGGRFYLVDAGPGAWNRLALWRVRGERIGGVLLTHFHSDHVGDLGEVDVQTWIAGRDGPLAVHGPAGVERVVAGFEEAYALDAGYRVAHHGAELLPPERAPMQAHPLALGADGRALVLERDGLRVTAFAVEHAPVAPAVGYRFEWRGRSVVVSGDTRPSQALVAAARGADVLVHEAQANHLVAIIGETAAAHGAPRIAKIMADIPSYHTSPVEAARVANEAGVGLLVLTHLTPPPPNRVAEWIFLRGVADVRAEGVVLARDGTLVELPAGGSDTVASRLE
jgi:ribonuclease Z